MYATRSTGPPPPFFLAMPYPRFHLMSQANEKLPMEHTDTIREFGWGFSSRQIGDDGIDSEKYEDRPREAVTVDSGYA